MNRQEMATITEQATGMAAVVMAWASLPETWPAFAAWAEQKSPGDTWGEDDRIAVDVFGKFLGQIAKGLEPWVG